MRKYISDVITKEEIRKWKIGDRILITAQTGTGKSQFIKDVLCADAVKRGKRILLLSNRNVLKNQNKADLGTDKSETITLQNYQAIESMMLEGESMYSIFNEYDYICFDECHYWFSDSTFNRNTDLLIHTLELENFKSIYVYITATPQVVKLYHSRFDYTYPSKEDKKYFHNFDFINNLYFYNKEETIESMLSTLPPGEQAIYFSSALQAFEMSVRVPGSVFVCSENNSQFSKKSSKATLKEIEDECKFSGKVLCTTSILDTGTSIKSTAVKHIVIDILDPIVFLQSLGRKRISDDEKINVYVKNYHNGKIYFQLHLLNAKLKIARDREDLGKDEFQDQYARQTVDPIVLTNGMTNQAKYYQSLYNQSVFAKIMEDEDKMGYKKMVCRMLEFVLDNTKNADEHFEKQGLESMLESYIGKRLFKGDDQEIFKEIFFEHIFSPKRKINYRKRGMNSINSIMEEDSIRFRVIANQANELPHRGRRYWQITRLETKLEGLESDAPTTN